MSPKRCVYLLVQLSHDDRALDCWCETGASTVKWTWRLLPRLKPSLWFGHERIGWRSLEKVSGSWHHFLFTPQTSGSSAKMKKSNIYRWADQPLLLLLHPSMSDQRNEVVPLKTNTTSRCTTPDWLMHQWQHKPSPIYLQGLGLQLLLWLFPTGEAYWGNCMPFSSQKASLFASDRGNV